MKTHRALLPLLHDHFGGGLAHHVHHVQRALGLVGDHAGPQGGRGLDLLRPGHGVTLRSRDAGLQQLLAVVADKAELVPGLTLAANLLGKIYIFQAPWAHSWHHFWDIWCE